MRGFWLLSGVPGYYIQVMVIQKEHANILDLLREEGAEAARKAQRGLILQPGAVGDCILTLPLAGFMKEALGLGGVDIMGHPEYIDYLPGRSCIDGITSIDSLDLHRLFTDRKEFDVVDRDPLVSIFGGYAWIATFLGEPDSDFEHNLIYTANCSGSSDVVTMAMKAPKDYAGHLTDFYAEQFAAQSGLSARSERGWHGQSVLKATGADVTKGRELLIEAGLDPDRGPVVIHPGSGGVKKCWHVDNFLAVCEALELQGVDALFLLGPAELDRHDSSVVEKIGNLSRCLSGLSLPQVLGLLTCAGAFIGNDSGITHLAAALGVKTFALFGPSDPALYGPVGPAVTILGNNPRTFAKKPSVRAQQKLIHAVLA